MGTWFRSGRGVHRKRGAAAPVSMIALETPSTTVVSGGITWTFNQTVQWFKVDGWPVVIDPGGLTIVSRSPAATTISSSAVNGTMKNPQRIVGGDPTASQGWDARIQGGSYSVALNASFPISVTANDIVVGAIGAAAPVQIANVYSPVQEYCPLYIVSGQKPVGSVLPAAMGWSGRGAPAWYSFDAAAQIAAWGSAAQRSTAGMTLPTYAAVLASLARFEVAWGRNIGASDGGYEDEMTYEWPGAGISNYGREVAAIVGAASLYLISDAITAGQKEVLLRHLVRHGVQSYDPAAGQGDAPVKANGGHWQFDFVPKVLALHCLGRTTALDTLHTVHPGNPLLQPFVFDSTKLADLAPHSSATKPYPYRLRTISAVAGNVITIPALLTYPNGDPDQVEFAGLRLKRQSDGASAVVTATVNNGSTYSLTIDAQPGSPFAVGNTIYCESIDPIRVGDADWQISGDAWWSHYNPSYAAAYREMSRFTEEVLVPRALGIWRSAWDAMERYVIRANRGNDPANGRDFWTQNDPAGGAPMAQQFWTAHAATILTGIPQFLEKPTISGTGEVGSVLTATMPTMAGTATITFGSYQWMADGVDISGATSATYTPVSGDMGKVITFRVAATNGSGSTTVYSAAGPTVIAAFAANGVAFASNQKVTYNSLSVPQTKKFTFVWFMRVPTVWPSTGGIITFLNSGGTQQIYANFASTGRLLFAAGAQSYVTANNALSADTVPNGAYTRIGVSVDTTAGQRRHQMRINNTVLTMTGFPSLADDTLFSALGRYYINDALVAMDLSEVWCDFNSALDLSDNLVWAKFAANASRGANGSIPTGAAPALYLSGDAATFGTNKGTGGGGTVSNGPLTNSTYDPA